MGGYGSGGHNKTHGRVEEHLRVDSFDLMRRVNWFDLLVYDGELEFSILGGKIIFDMNTWTGVIYCGESWQTLKFSKVPNVDGISYRVYFLCPHCGKRVRYLYRDCGIYHCRECAKLNYGIQQRSGLLLLQRKMYWLVMRKLQYVDWELEHPDIMIQDLWHIPKPRYMRWAKYDALMEEYRQLQDEYETIYNASLMKSFARINKLLG